MLYIEYNVDGERPPWLSGSDMKLVVLAVKYLTPTYLKVYNLFDIYVC